MSNIVIKDSRKFEKIIDELEKTIPAIEDSFETQNKNYKIIENTDNYRGKCQEVINEKYKDVKNNYNSIDEALINYIKFLKITLNNYKRYEETTNTTINNNEYELNVN